MDNEDDAAERAARANDKLARIVRTMHVRLSQHAEQLRAEATEALDRIKPGELQPVFDSLAASTNEAERLVSLLAEIGHLAIIEGDTKP